MGARSFLAPGRSRRIRRVLFSIKIVPPICADTGSFCPSVDLQESSTVSLDIENLFSPQSAVENSIGFQIAPAGYPNPVGAPFLTDTVLNGNMSIDLTNVFIRLSNGAWIPLTSGNAGSIGKIATRGNVDIRYGPGPPN
jgi:hypothetical protein